MTAGRGPTVTLFCGLPGSGKTTLARRLEEAGHGVRICTDEWQAALGVDYADLAGHERLQMVLYRHALELLRHGVDVILEDGLWTRAERVQKFSDARGSGARIDLQVFDVPLDTLWSRLQERNQHGGFGAHPVSFDEFRLACSVFQPPTPEELTSADRYTVRNGGLD